MKKQKQIKASVLAVLMVAVLFIGCSKDDDTQPQTETPGEETPTGEVDKAPEISAQTFTAKEDIADDTVIGTVVATDPEGKALTFTLTKNSDDLFEVSDSGELSLTAGKGLDFETKTEHTISVKVSDNVLSSEAQITIAVVNVKDFVTVSTFAGSGLNGFLDGSGNNAKFGTLEEMAVDKDGNIYVADITNHCIRKITRDGTVSTFAGTNSAGYKDGIATEARFNKPYGLTIDAAGNLYVGDDGNHLIRKITPAGVVSTYAGNGLQGDEDGPATSASFHFLGSLHINEAGDLFVSDGNFSMIRKVNKDGQVSRLTKIVGVSTKFRGVTMDRLGNLYVADFNANLIRKIEPTGAFYTFAGTGEKGFKDGNVSEAQFDRPHGIAIDSRGDIYVTTINDHRIRKISNGVVSTITGGEKGFKDGASSEARFNVPRKIMVDANDDVYVTDGVNYRVRKITVE